MAFQGAFLLFDKSWVRPQENASTFVVEHKYILPEMYLRFPANVRAFWL